MRIFHTKLLQQFTDLTFWVLVKPVETRFSDLFIFPKKVFIITTVCVLAALIACGIVSRARDGNLKKKFLFIRYNLRKAKLTVSFSGHDSAFGNSSPCHFLLCKRRYTVPILNNLGSFFFFFCQRQQASRLAITPFYVPVTKSVDNPAIADFDQKGKEKAQIQPDWR